MERQVEGLSKGERVVGSIVLCALYLRGAPRCASPRRPRWPLVREAVSRHLPGLGEVAEALRDGGLWDEAGVVDNDELIRWAAEAVEEGHVLTPFMPGYPIGWLEALGSAAPPCVWASGTVPKSRAVAITGSRAPSRRSAEVCREIGREAMRLGCTLVSGGARGADSIAIHSAIQRGGAERAVVILPYGIGHRACNSANDLESSGAWRAGAVESSQDDCGAGPCYLSVCEPWAGFTTGQAMERNALIYSFGRRAVAVSPRLRKGGTWHGAVDALRRRLCSLWVAGAGLGADALAALGAHRFMDASDLQLVLDSDLPLAQPDLFGATAVREAHDVKGLSPVVRG